MASDKSDSHDDREERAADSRILGTRVPDTPIHRASLWLEDVKYTDSTAERRVEVIEDQLWQRFIEGCRLHPVTPGQLQEAADYYGTNMHVMLTGGQLDVRMPSPTGEGHIDLRSILISVWLDGFMHGAATAAGRTAQSTAERAAERLLRPE